MAACDEKDFEEQYIQADELDMTVTKQEIQQTKKIYGTQWFGYLLFYISHMGIFSCLVKD